MLTIHYSVVDSTNDRARRFAAVDPTQPLRVIADVQTRGRGRSGRRWTSPPGGAWFSLVWPTGLPSEALRPAPLLVGLAVCEALTGYLDPVGDVSTVHSRHGSMDHTEGAPGDQTGPAAANEPPRIKWPNDVLFHNHKLAGILCEQQVTTVMRRGGPQPLIVGIGINANLDPMELPEDLRGTALSLQAIRGEPVDLDMLRADVSDRVLTALAMLTSSGLSETCRAHIEAWLAWRQEAVTLKQAGRSTPGTLRGIDTRGRLRLDTDAGPQVFDAGEVQCAAAPGRDDA